jgi:hypothetical protein
MEGPKGVLGKGREMERVDLSGWECCDNISRVMETEGERGREGERERPRWEIAGMKKK